MRLYIAIRFGNHNSPDGPDGEDTHFLIRAHDYVEAVRLADGILRTMPTSCAEGHRSVQPFCHKVIEIGSDGSSCVNVQEDILMGPWFAYGFSVHHVGYRTWSRNDFDTNVWEIVNHDG